MNLSLTDYEEDLALITRFATEAGALALPYFNGDVDLDVQIKNGNSPVSAADFAVNEFLMEHLRSARPNYGWLSEETLDDNRVHRMDAQRTFVVDPIDGTRGFIQGLDMWCISVAVVENGQTIAGVLVCPARGETYTSAKGKGAFNNGKPMTLPDTIAVAPLIGGPRIFLDAMDMETQDVFVRQPHVPSLAYRIAMVANGEMAATFIKPNAHDWDIAAAILILEEAGGVLFDEKGVPPTLNGESPKKPVMFASHPQMASQMLSIVAQTPFG